MLRRTLLLLRNEIEKTLRAKIAYVGIAAVCAACAVVFLSTEAYDRSTLSGWAYVALAMQGGFADVGVIFIGLFSAMLLADETGTGTARMVLASPIRRREFYLAKVLTGFGYMMVLSGIALGVSMALGAGRYEYGAVSDAIGLIYPAREVIRCFLVAFFASWLPLAAVVSFGILVSAVTDKAGLAIGIVLGALIFGETLKHFVHIGPFLFTTYVPAAWAVFHDVAQGVDYEWRPEIWWILGVPAGYCIVSLSAGLFLFCRRDLTA